MKLVSSKSLTALAAVLGVGGLALTGCGGSNLPSVRSVVSPTPTTGTPTPGTSPTPGTGTPTPTPTGTPGTGTPTPTPTATPGAGTLASYYGTFTDNRTLTYRDTSTVTSTDPLTGQPTSNTTTTTFTTGGSSNPFAFGNAGQRTQVSLATAQGNVTVTRQELVDEQGRVDGYTYYTLDSNAYTLYGADTLDEQGRTISRTRYNPAIRFSLDLRVGQTATSTTRATQTIIDPDENTSTDSVYDQTFTLTFVGIESVTVPAGTYANAARVNFGFTFNSPAQNGQPPFSSTLTSTSWYAQSVGLAKSTSDSRSTIEFDNPVSGETQTLETRVQSNTELIAVAQN